MIPIEELKLAILAELEGVSVAFDDTYWGIETFLIYQDLRLRFSFWWYLLRNWNTQSSQIYIRNSGFWWYLLRNWNQLWRHRLPRSNTFWWYLLRNWNLQPAGRENKRRKLLMIPIEELKLVFVDAFALPATPFDDTYWGIETRCRCISWHRILPFDDTYWGIETKVSQPIVFPIHKLLMIPIEELKPRSLRQHRQAWDFWWYLLRNWNSNRQTEYLQHCNLLMIPIEELKPYLQ